jgi:hypothetical protein
MTDLTPSDVSGWTYWQGGECPVLPHTLVDVWHRENSLSPGTRAGVWSWLHAGLPSDILAYRLSEVST